MKDPDQKRRVAAPVTSQGATRVEDLPPSLQGAGIRVFGSRIRLQMQLYIRGPIQTEMLIRRLLREQKAEREAQGQAPAPTAGVEPGLGSAEALSPELLAPTGTAPTAAEGQGQGQTADPPPFGDAPSRPSPHPSEEPTPSPSGRSIENSSSSSGPPAAGAAPPASSQDPLELALAAKDPKRINAVAVTRTLRNQAVDSLADSHQIIVQLVALNRTDWFAPVLDAAFAKQSVELALMLTSDLQGKQALAAAALKRSAVPFLLTVVGRAPTGWATAVLPEQYDQIIATAPHPVVEAQHYHAIWALWGSGNNRSKTAARATFSCLYTSRILPPGDQSATWPQGDTNSGGITYAWRILYMPVTPNDTSTNLLLNAIRSMPQGQVNVANIAFAHQAQQQWRKKAPPPIGAWKSSADARGTTAIGTSYYLDATNTIIIQSSAGGAVSQTAIGQESDGNALAVGGSKEAGAPALTFFQNHARHEIGHAVGHRRFEGVPETGDEFARSYGGWQQKSQAEFIAAYWNRNGRTKLDFSSVGGSKDVEVDDKAVAEWLACLIATGTQPDGNAITDQKADEIGKLQIIKSAYFDQQLTNYFSAVFQRSGNQLTAMKDNGYVFPGFSPSSTDVYIYCSRGTPAGFACYSKAAHRALVSSHGWYSLASHREMFAEIYTNKYASGRLPPAVNGQDPALFFKQLETSKEAGASVSPAGGGAAGGAAIEANGDVQDQPPLNSPPLLLGDRSLGEG